MSNKTEETKKIKKLREVTRREEMEKNGKIVGTVSILRDIIERKKGRGGVR